MSKSSNKQQLQHLLTLMEANAEIARGFFKGGKEELQRFWRKAEAELNTLGPPVKNITEWKKVWADQKKYVRQKAAQNLQYQKGTGGGPNKENKFSSSEQTIYNIIGMKTSVEGVPVNKFGLGCTKEQIQLPEPTAETVFLENAVAEVLQEEDLQDSIAPKCSGKPNPIPKSKAATSKKYLESPSDALKAELAIQRELLETLKKAVVDMKEQQQSVRKIYKCLDKMNEQQCKHFQEMEKMKKNEIDEMRRHHAFMEQMRAREVEYKIEKNNLQLQIAEVKETL